MTICDAFCQYHGKVANLLTYALLELKELSGKREKFLFYQNIWETYLKKPVSGKPLINDGKMETWFFLLVSVCKELN